MLKEGCALLVATWALIGLGCTEQRAEGELDSMARLMMKRDARCQDVDYAPTPGVGPFRDCRVEIGDTTGVFVTDATGAVVFVGKKWSSDSDAAMTAFDRISNDMSESYGRPETTESNTEVGRQVVRRWDGSGFSVELTHSVDGELRLEWTLRT